MNSLSMRSAAVLLFAGLLLPASQAAADAPDFVKDVAPIFTKYCTGCHNDDDREGKLSLESYDGVLKGGAKGGVVTPGEAELSRLVRVITGQAEPKMPPDDEPGPNAEELAKLKAWIAAGAKGPSGAVGVPLLVTPQIKLLAPPKPGINAVALSPDGTLLAIARHGEVELQDVESRQTLVKLDGIPGSVNSVAFSDDGQQFVAAAGEAGLYGEARVYQVVGTLRVPSDGTRSVPTTSNGTRSVPTTFRGHRDSLYTAALSPDGAILATGGYDHTIKLWDVASGRELRTLDAHNGAVFQLAFRAGGKVLASASGDRTVKLWDVASGERLDTLKESTQELYALAFSPDGSRLAAAGVDNRIRIWRITKDAQEGTNVLIETRFAHESPVLRLAWSADGRTIASAGEDRLVKIWNAEPLSIRHTLEEQSDWASGLALSAKGDLLVVGRIDGTLGTYSLAAADAEREQPLVPLAEVPPEVDYGPQPAIGDLPKVTEIEPNDEPHQATSITVPGKVVGTLRVPSDGTRSVPTTGNGTRSVPATYDADLFRFDAQAGDQWIIETNAARSNSPADTKIEVLDAEGRPVPRLLLRAVRDTIIEFRGMNSEQRGVRLANWEEMLLNEYVYLSGEVIKHYQQRRGPDADAQFYPENGSRMTFFDTSPRAHALDEPGYIVVPYPVGTELPNNGLPVFTLYYENDDDGQRKLGKDSRLTFVAPADGTYLVRVSDVRGFGGDSYSYELIVRRPAPDFQVTLSGNNPTVAAGSGKPFTVKAERIDNFNGPIRVEIEGLPPGFQATTPLVIQEGLYEAHGVINALPDAAAPTEEQLKQIKVTATATVYGQERTKQAGSLGTIKLADKPKVIVHLELDQAEQASAAVGQASRLPGSSQVGQASRLPVNPMASAAQTDADSETSTAGETPAPLTDTAGETPAPLTDQAAETPGPLTEFPTPPEITIAPGATVTARLRVERHGFDGRIGFDVANLPHGVIVDDIGLSGVLIPEGQTERTIFLRAEPWVPEQTRAFFATAQVEGNQCSLPMLLHVRRTEK